MTLATVTSTPEVIPPNTIDFLWIELTNRCNLECVHCYAGSSPNEDDGVLNADDYGRVLVEAHGAGCRRVQFIGGEPTLNHSLPDLIRHSANIGFEFIEVYTNLVRLPTNILSCIQEHGVHVATSIYSDQAQIHDSVTTRQGSWVRTVGNIKRLQEMGLPLRVSIIEMDENQGTMESITKWLKSIGVKDIGTDRLRHFGRGKECQNSDMSELCGNCASGTLCVGPDGAVAPCIMSKAWGVGSVLQDSIASIVNSIQLSDTRHAIFEATKERQKWEMGGCQPDSKNPCGPDCGPGNACNPCSPKGHCPPNSCAPK